jgi:hypothetical protein
VSKSVELELALQKLQESKALVLATRKAEKETAEKRRVGLKEVKALMRQLKVSASDLTDPKFV